MIKELYINESSLSRLWSHNELHDCGALTAFRKARDCNNGEKYTKKEKLQRNKSLRAKLRSLGYGVTSLSGQYPEGGVIEKEESYFVVDLLDNGNLEKDIIKLGIEFDQDSVLIIPKGAILNKTKAFLYGTNYCLDNEIGWGNKVIFNKGKVGYTSPIYTSYVNGRPFIFESVGREILRPGNGFGVWGLHTIAKKHWSEIEI